MNDSIKYFDEIYSKNDDPWQYTQRWYEQRKREICLALLLKKHYNKILELGCSNGVFSQSLAARCNALTCIDGNRRAVQLAKERLKNFEHSQVLHMQLPAMFPDETFDLIVIGEIAYYLDSEDLSKLIELCLSHLSADGMILSCHWRYPIEGFQLNGEDVHFHLKQKLSLSHYLSLRDKDFLVDLWSKEDKSLAFQEDLL